MIKQLIISCIIVFSLFIVSPVSEVVFAAAGSTTSRITTKPSSHKVTAKNKITKKKRKVVRKEKLTLTPPLFTLDTAPHSPKPITKYKKKSTKKKVIGKKKS